MPPAIPLPSIRHPRLKHAFAALQQRCLRRNLRPDSIETYGSLWNQVATEFGAETRLRSIRTRHLQAWLDELRTRRAPKTVRLYRTFLAMLFNAALQAELISGSNPVLRTEPVPLGKLIPRRRLTEGEIASLFAALRSDTSERGRLWTTVFGIMLVTGLRIREAVLLRWEDFLWEEGILSPSHQKRSSLDDLLLITPELARIVTLWNASSERTGLLFPQLEHFKSKRIFCGSGLYYMKKVAARARLDQADTVGTHCLRRSFITIAAGASRGDHLTLMQVARHRSLAMTRLYMPTISNAVAEVSREAARAAGLAMGLSPSSLAGLEPTTIAAPHPPGKESLPRPRGRDRPSFGTPDMLTGRLAGASLVL